MVSRAGTLPVYTVKPENKDGPLRTLHRDLLLPCGYLPTKESIEPVQRPAKHRPATRVNPAVDADRSSEEDDELIPVYWFNQPPQAQVPAVHESLVLPDPPMSNEQDTQHTEPPDVCSVESPVNAQNADCTPEIDKQPDMSDCTPDSPLTLDKPTSRQGDTEYLSTERVIT